MKKIALWVMAAVFLVACGESSSPELNVGRLWSKRDMEKTRSLVVSMGGINMRYTITQLKKPPFYNGSMPLKFESYVMNMGGGMTGLDTIKLCYDFGGWRNVFIYENEISLIQSLPEGAVAFDNKTGRILAECKVMKLLDSDGQLSGFEILETHYNKDGKAIYSGTFEASFPEGYKVKELQSQGKKEKEYFFLWLGI